MRYLSLLLLCVGCASVGNGKLDIPPCPPGYTCTGTLVIEGKGGHQIAAPGVSQSGEIVARLELKLVGNGGPALAPSDEADSTPANSASVTTESQ